MANRIVYQNWIVDLGCDPQEIHSNRAMAERIQDEEHIEQIRQAVKAALAELDEDEREFIIHFYYMGESYRQISDKSSRLAYNLSSLHFRSLRKLRKLLAPFAHETFGIGVNPPPVCPICSSTYVEQLNQLISNRDRRQTWKPVLDILRMRYNIVITSPQLLVGHEKYH